MSEREYRVRGEVIKIIHGELPAVRWTCGACLEDSCTIFYEKGELEKTVECENCGATNVVTKQ